MTGVLVTGATGKTGSAVAALLRADGVPVRVASRRPAVVDGDAVVFDWDDPATHRATLTGLDRVYLVAPPLEVAPQQRVAAFLGEADRQEIRQVVFLGSAIEFPGAPGILELTERIRERPGGTVLLPSAFMQNFLRPHPVATRIRADGEIRTSAGTGGVGWIDVADIAAVTITAETGRPVRVIDVGVEEVAAAYRAAGMPPAFATSLAELETGIRAGHEERISTSVLELTGRAPRTFADFVRRHASEWA